jgi:predicted dehydrogenase
MTMRRDNGNERGMNRRRMLQAATLAAGAAWGSKTRSIWAQGEVEPKREQDKIRIGAIGVGGRASLLLDQLPDDAQIVALSDCNLPRAEAFKAKHQANWDIYQDYRKLLDRKDVDGVIVATGEFQRVLPCIHACQAGKDVYAEKPLTLYVAEGRALVQAVRKYRRILQVGSQQRSMTLNRLACEFIRQGGLGPLREIRAMNYAGAESSPPNGFPEVALPVGLDWDAWLGQAASRPFHPEWMTWMRWRDFAGGEMTNWGAHGVDQIQWALGMDASGPTSIEPLSPGPNGQVKMMYPHGVPVHFVLEAGRGPMGGAVFIGENGKLEINRNKFTSNPPEIAEQLRREVDVAEEERKWSDDTALWQARWHLQNWLDCIRTRDLPVADVEIGHRSITVCHLANIARAVGRPLTWDPVAEEFPNDPEANLHLNRERRKGFELPG